jgi:hypothetical protein
MIVQLTLWGVENLEMDGRLVAKMRGVLGLLNLKTPEAAQAWVEEDAEMDAEELAGMDPEEAAVECVEKIRMRMAAVGLLER